MYFSTSNLFLSGSVYIVIDISYSHLYDILLAYDISTVGHFASLLENCHCLPREDVFPIFALGSVRGNTVPRDSIDTYTPGSRECIG